MSEERNNQVETAVLVDAERTEINESEALNPDVVIVNPDNNDSASRSSLWSFHSCDGTGTAERTEVNESETLNPDVVIVDNDSRRTLVTGTNTSIFLTIVGFILYLVDLGSDIGAAIFFASNRQWWQALVTLAIFYGAVIIQTVVKWTEGRIHCPGAADRLRYLAAMLINWPDIKQYWELCRLQWQLHKSPTWNALLIPEWNQRSRNIALLKYMEGMCESCPQAILQLCLLVPDLYGTWTWTDYLRIAGASVSLSTVGVALVNREKFDRINSSIDLPLDELLMLYVWAVPVTVSRLLSVALFVTLYPYWLLAGVALHLVMRVVFCCSTKGHSSALNTVVVMCLDTLQFLISSFAVTGSIKYRRVSHAIHLLVNTVMTVVWALGAPLETAHPGLYNAIICFYAVMFVVGLVGWQLHEKYWPHTYPKPND